MRAMRVDEFGGPEVIRSADVPMPTPAEGEVRIAVRTLGMNYADLAQREGKLPVARPFIPGFEIAGVVDAVGAGAVGIEPGTRVVAVLSGGGAAGYAVAPATSVVAIPDALSFDRAVALPSQGSTALLGLRDAARVREGDAIFVPSAAGGVGTLMLQLARRLGAGRVLGGASSEVKRALALRLGAHAAIDTSRDDWPSRVRDETGGRGADVVFATGGGAELRASLRGLAPGGRLVMMGVDTLLEGELGRAELAGVMMQNQSLVGFATFGLPETARRAAIEDVIALAVSGAIGPVVGQTFALEDLADAHRAMAARTTTGKIVITVDSGRAGERSSAVA